MPTVQHWSAGWSQGPSLPDPDAVMHGGTLAEARDHLIADVENELQAADDMATDVRDQFTRVWSELYDLDMDKLAADAELSRADRGNWEAWAHGWQYWLMPCFIEDCDQVEEEQ